MRLTSSGLLAEQSREDWRELERQQESEFDLPFSFLPPSTEPLTPFDQLRRHFPTLFQESSGSHIGGHRRTFRQREMDVAQLLLGPTEDQLSYEVGQMTSDCSFYLFLSLASVASLPHSC